MVSATQGALVGNVRTWNVAGLEGASAEIRAVAANGSTWDGFHLTFLAAGATPTVVTVRPITRDIDWGISVPVPGFEGE